MTRNAANLLNQLWQGLLETSEVAVAIGYRAPWSAEPPMVRESGSAAR